MSIWSSYLKNYQALENGSTFNFENNTATLMANIQFLLSDIKIKQAIFPDF